MVMNTIKISDLFSDCPVILVEKSPSGKQVHYYELRFDDVSLDGFSDQPIQVFLKKGNRITQKELYGW